MVYFRHMKQGGHRKKASRLTISAASQWRFRFSDLRHSFSFAKSGTRQRGFTIVETLIVLAVTGALFVVAALLINGRQNKTEFSTAINNLQQQLQQIIGQTESGYFPNNGNFSCTIDTADSNHKLNITATPARQGTNQDCIFLGNVLQFGLDSGNGQQFAIWPMAGNRQGTTIKGPFASSGAQPTPVVPLKTYEQLQYGLNAVSMEYSTTGATPSKSTSGVGFLSGDSNGSFATPDATGLQSGSQQFSLYAVDNTKLKITDESNMEIKLGQPIGIHLEHATSLNICLASATTDQSGLITIGTTGGDANLSVTLALKNGTVC
jgi:prepilin-type N-terminal cleavage/methylation domain-containing protein